MRASAFAALLVATMGCRTEPPVPAASSGNPPAVGNVPAASPAPETPAPATTPPALERVASKCPDEKVVSAGGDDTPEGVLFDAYRLALGPDSEEAQEAFYRLFTQGAPKSHLLDEIWPRVREHVRKYVPDPQHPSYTVCRRVPAAADRVKIFVRCLDSRKSDPPSVLILEQGKWRLDVMTP
jgi:hypothetical protein